MGASQSAGRLATYVNAIHPLTRAFDGQLDSQEHREELLLVVVVHLDLGNVGPRSGDVVHDRIGQTFVVRPDGGDGDLHRGGHAAVELCRHAD